MFLFPLSSFRCTLTNIPQTQALLNKAKLPLGLLLHPFRDLTVKYLTFLCVCLFYVCICSIFIQTIKYNELLSPKFKRSTKKLSVTQRGGEQKSLEIATSLKCIREKPFKFLFLLLKIFACLWFSEELPVYVLGSQLSDTSWKGVYRAPLQRGAQFECVTGLILAVSRM